MKRLEEIRALGYAVDVGNVVVVIFIYDTIMLCC
jgi:hypothetical protein